MDCGIQETGWSFDYLETRGTLDKVSIANAG